MSADRSNTLADIAIALCGIAGAIVIITTQGVI